MRAHVGPCQAQLWVFAYNVLFQVRVRSQRYSKTSGGHGIHPHALGGGHSILLEESRVVMTFSWFENERCHCFFLMFFYHAAGSWAPWGRRGSLGANGTPEGRRDDGRYGTRGCRGPVMMGSARHHLDGTTTWGAWAHAPNGLRAQAAPPVPPRAGCALAGQPTGDQTPRAGCRMQRSE